MGQKDGLVQIKGVKGQGERKESRDSGLELLRCLAMMMVVALHFLAKGNLLGDLTGQLTTTQFAAWLLESFAICAVNLYMLLSGYLLCFSQFKITRLLQLVLQTLIYSLCVGLLGILMGWVSPGEVNTYFKLQMIFPFLEGQYWFITVYLFLYLMLPLLGAAVRRMDRRTFRVVLAVFLLVFCVSKSVLPFRLEIDKKGYDLNWYLCEFLTAAYIRRFGIPFLEKNRWRGMVLYIASSLGILGLTLTLHEIYLRSGRMGTWMTVAWDYNHVLTFMAALGLFTFFAGREKEKGKTGFIGRLAVWAGPYTLGVYLLHESIAVRFVWPSWFGAGRITTPGDLLLGTFLAAAIVFAAGVLVEFIRCRIMLGLHRILLHFRPYARGMEKLKDLDGCFDWRAEGKDGAE